jgi:hypothetical protein
MSSELGFWFLGAGLYLVVGWQVGRWATRTVLAYWRCEARSGLDQHAVVDAAFLGVAAMAGWPLVLVGAGLLWSSGRKE